MSIKIVIIALFEWHLLGASGQSVTLAWDPSDDPSVTSYVVRYGTKSASHSNMVDAGDQTTVTVTGLSVGAGYYFVVHAVNEAGIESLPSNEVFTVVVGPRDQRSWYRVQATMEDDFELQQSADLVTWHTVASATDHIDAVLPIAGGTAFFRVSPWSDSGSLEGHTLTKQLP